MHSLDDGKGEKMKITMLGTGNAMVTECYNTCFVLSEQQQDLQYFLVDAGGGNGEISGCTEMDCA